jgi:hypothetical protein
MWGDRAPQVKKKKKFKQKNISRLQYAPTKKKLKLKFKEKTTELQAPVRPYKNKIK